MSFWKDCPVLVTGAGGFIGSHLVEALASEGAHVRAFVHYNARNDPGMLSYLQKDILHKVEVIPGDLRNLPGLIEASRGISHIFHLGALISIPYSYSHPAQVVETNILGTLNVLQAARYSAIERLVHTSSSEVYGTALRVPIDETHPLQGQSPYSASKIGADMLVDSFSYSYDLPVVTLRPFNTYGPRQSARAVVPTIMIQALTQDNIRLGKLDTKRDFTYISDTVDGFLKIGQVDGIEGGHFNLGSGHEASISELVQIVSRLVGKELKVVIDPDRLRPERSEVLRLLSDNRMASERLGWKPKVDLERGLQLTYEWMKVNLDAFHIGELVKDFE